MKQIIIGCGTGRCGTVSLSRLLNAQANSAFTHELLPRMSWAFDSNRFRIVLGKLLGRPQHFTGDVAFYWLPYLSQMIRAYPSIAVVGLKRDRQETIDSYVQKVAKRKANHWMAHDGSQWKADGWDRMYPKFEATDLRDALGQYWDHYYSRLESLAKTHPDNVRVWNMAQLNDAEAVKDVLTFCHYDPAKFVVSTGIHANRSV